MTQACLQALECELAVARLAACVLRHGLAVPRSRRPTKPTASSKARRLETKRRHSQRKRERRRPADEG